MALVKRDRFELPELFRRMFDTEWDTGAGFLRVEELVDDHTLTIRAEMPDIDPEKDVELSVADGVLHLRAERHEKTEHKDKEVFRSEFRYGSFVRNVPLPKGTEIDDVTATYTDGILEIKVPLPAEVKPETTRIPVTRA